jgi:hypothetical protein
MPLPIIDAKKFTQISNDWAEMFPEYKKYRKGIFSKVVGPFEFSVFIELWSHKEKYRSSSCISPFLTKTDIMGAFLTTETMTNGSIGWQGHTMHKLHLKAADYLREHTPFPLEGPVTVSQVLNAYEKAAGKRGFYIEDAEAPALLCGWLGRPELAPQWIEWGREKYLASYKKNMAYKESIKGTPEDERYTVKTTLEYIDQWTEEIHQRVRDTEYLRQLVEDQIKKFKYDKFPRYDLIVDV